MNNISTLSSSFDYINLTFYYSFHTISNVPVLIGNSDMSYSFVPDLNSSFSFVNEKDLCKRNDDSCNALDGRVINDSLWFVYENQVILGRILSSEFKFKQNRNKPFQLYYYLSKSYSQSLCSTFGLAANFFDTNYSIIHQLKQKGFINSLSFAFEFKTSSCSSFYLGSLPRKNTANKNHGYIDVIDLSIQWAFHLSAVILKNNTRQIVYQNKTISYFISLSEYIYVPSSFLDIIINDYLKELVELRICQVQSSVPMRYILCLKGSNLKIGEVTFVIEYFSYVFSIEKLWICGEDLCILSLRENTIDDKWIFGYQFYKEFTTVFDYETKQIHFYVSNSNDKVKIDRNTNGNNLYLSIMIGMNIIYLIIGVLLLLRVKNKLN